MRWVLAIVESQSSGRPSDGAALTKRMLAGNVREAEGAAKDAAKRSAQADAISFKTCAEQSRILRRRYGRAADRMGAIVGDAALKSTILTAERTTEATRAQEEKIRLEASVWTVPVERMKAARTPLLQRWTDCRNARCGRHHLHSFRSTVRDWLQETTNYAGAVTATALGHIAGDKVEALIAAAIYSRNVAS